MAERRTELGGAGASGFIVATGAVVAVAGLALAAVRFVGGTPAERGAEAALGSFAGVTLPLLIPAVMLTVAYGRRSSGHAPPRGTTAGTLAAVFVLLVAAVAVLFLHEDPRSYRTGTGGGSTSDVITYAESVPSLTLSVAAVAAGWFLAEPRRVLTRRPSR